MLITVFTPTYNRAETLRRTFESLCAQSFQDFEWLVVDDGSTDRTSEQIAEFKKCAQFPIEYHLKENGGKHTAYNSALTLAKGRLFFTVDSDDWLPEHSLELISQKADELLSDSRLGGIVALKELPDGKIISRSYPKNLHRSTLQDLERAGLGGERSLVFKTAVAAQYPFPVICGERFMTECVVYDKIAMAYEFLTSNDVLTICEYQDCGLSSNPRKLMALNPGGYKIYFRNRIDQASGMKERLNYIVRYLIFKHLTSPKKQVDDYHGRWNFICRLLSPAGILAAQSYRNLS